jgi:hypothetical protein
MTQTGYRVQPGNRPTDTLLHAEAQISSAWHRDDLDRSGISVCESRQALAGYLATVGEGIPYGSGGWVLVELEGTESDDTPLDAEHGEILLHPTRIVSVTSLDDDTEMWDMIGAAYDTATEE